MTTLEDLKAEVDHLREVVRVADSGSMEATALLRAQTSLMKALRQNQNDMQVILNRQGDSLADMLLSLNRLHPKVDRLELKALALDAKVVSVDLKVTELDSKVEGLDRRQERTEQRLTRMEERQDRMEARMDRMDRNIVAIMGHLGVDSPDEP